MPRALLCLLLIGHVASAKSPCSSALGAGRDARQSFVRRYGRPALGYALLVAAMIANAEATNALVPHLPPEYQGLVRDVSTLGGTFVFGAPIVRPLSARVERFAWGLKGEARLRPQRRDDLEAQYEATNQTLTMTAQMSSSRLGGVHAAIKPNFYEARRAMLSGDVAYAVDQVAEAAVRLRRLYPDLAPDEESIALAVRTSFSAHAGELLGFRERVLAQIRAFDRFAADQVYARAYDQMMDAWL